MTGRLDGYVPKTVCTAPSAKVVRGPILVASKPRITGTAVVGGKLTAHPRTWDARVTLHYQWQRDGKNIAGATSLTYTIRSRDAGHSIRVRVKGTAPGRESRSEYSKAVRPKLR